MSTGFWQISPTLATDPPIVETTALAIVPLTLDTAPYLGEGETPSAPLTSLLDLTTGRAVDIPDPRLAGTVITQVVGALERGHDYQLVFAFSVGPRHRKSRIMIVRCVA
jgi:hypothetical protein